MSYVTVEKENAMITKPTTTNRRAVFIAPQPRVRYSGILDSCCAEITNSG